MAKWKSKTFQFDHCKDIHCRTCGRYLKHDSRLSDDKMIRIVCPECKTSNVIFPPRKAIVENKPVILFGDSAPGRNPMDCTFTADQTIV